MEPLSNFSTII